MNLDSQIQQLTPKSSDPLENILSKKIGYGEAQQKLSLSLYILLFTEGCESIALGLLLPQLQTQWSISIFQKSLLITMVYFGVSLGSYIQTFSDNFGRYTFITWNAILQTIFGLLSCISTSIQSFIVYRFFYGVGIGIVLPLSASYLAQITPSSHRGSILAKSRVYWSVGCLVTCFFGWLLLYNHRWRQLLFIICIPGIYALIEHKRNGRESLRYMWVKKQSENVHEMLNYMAKLNGKPQIQLAQIQYQIDQNIQTQKQGSFKDLFNQKYSKMSFIMILAWFSVCFIYYGVMLFLPSILARNATMTYNFKYFFLIVISIIEVISFYCSIFVMDHPQIGRKKAAYIGFYTVAVVSFIIILLGQNHSYLLLALFVIIKIMITTTFMILYPYTAQIYETIIRGKAMGFFSVCGRLATTILGMTGASALLWWNGQGLYIIFLILSLTSAISVSKMPYCTLGRPLDT